MTAGPGPGRARAKPGPLTHWPRPSCRCCRLAAHRPSGCCSQSVVGQLLGLRACRTTLAAAHFKLRSSGWCLARQRCPGGQLARPVVLMLCRSPTPVHCGCPPSLLHCQFHTASPRAITACGRYPSQSSLLHGPRLLVPLTCPKPGPNRRCALAGATLFCQVGHYSLSGGQGAICN